MRKKAINISSLKPVSIIHEEKNDKGTINHGTVTSGQVISKDYNKDSKNPYTIS